MHEEESILQFLPDLKTSGKYGTSKRALEWPVIMEDGGNTSEEVE